MTLSTLDLILKSPTLFILGPTLASFCVFLWQGTYHLWHFTSSIYWTFPHLSVVFIAGSISQWQWVLDRYAPLLVAVHQWMPLIQHVTESWFLALLSFQVGRCHNWVEWSHSLCLVNSSALKKPARSKIFVTFWFKNYINAISRHA